MGPLFKPPSKLKPPVRPKGFEGRVHRAQTVRATPPWQDVEEAAKVAKLYHEARRLTQQTGVLHVVDHIVPKISPLVCGLHVSWNMQVMHWRENAIKSNSEWPDMPFEQIPLF